MSYPYKASYYKHGATNLSQGEDNFIDQVLTMDDQNYYPSSSQNEPYLQSQFDYYQMQEQNSQNNDKNQNSQIQSDPNHQRNDVSQHQLISDNQLLIKRLSKRKHLTRDRRKKGQLHKFQLQKQSETYWTNNFLPIGKNPHFNFIQSKFKKTILKKNQALNQIYLKKGINMQDYITLYNQPSIRHIWKQFFDKKILYREIMLTRALPKNRKIFLNFMYRFQEAYKENSFDHIVDRNPTK